MSFLTHLQIYRPMTRKKSNRSGCSTAPVSSFDESATGYSSASCTLTGENQLKLSPPRVI
jgi:hypothetical protein